MKKLIKFNRTNDINGNAIIKAFYSDNTTEIIRGGAVNDFYIKNNVTWSSYNKSYKSIAGLRNSK